MRARASTLRLLRALPALAVLAALGAGCEVLIDGDLSSIRCADEGGVGPPACPGDQICRSGVCVALAGLGRACHGDTGCSPPDLCLNPKSFGGEGAPICARACCTSSDCDPDGEFVCWIPDAGGGGFCRAATSVGRPAVGAGRTGAPCAAPGDCRSGLCAEGRCADACCSDTNCAESDQTCQLTVGLVSEGAAWACRPPQPSKKVYLEACDGDSDCASGACAAIAGVLRCTQPCCGSGSCSGVVQVSASEARAVTCREVERGGVTFRACVGDVPTSAAGAVGAPCHSGDDCRGGACLDLGVPKGSVCSDACCTEASCGDPALIGCRPYYAGASWALRCEPK
ncbi:MAG: hypothetical protein IT372_19815 [Polyangiaceae bacterium]|nr:hypothetical protein [Polyangiaceae bacterium]